MQDELIGSDQQDFLRTTSERLGDYLVGFVLLEGGGEARLGGSGTFVSIDNRHAILTADHVIQNLPSSGEVGLVLISGFRPQLHSPKLNMDYVQKVTVARGSEPSKGPDLALLVLPDHDVATIKGIKSFFNLGIRREKMLREPPDQEVGQWILSGMAAEWTTEEPPEKGVSRVFGFHGFTGVGLVGEESSEGDFDYRDFLTKRGEGYEGPNRYGGFSGGGLWQVLTRVVDDKLIGEEFLLSGVAFYESDLEGDESSIRCHGRKSIYGAAIDATRPFR